MADLKDDGGGLEGYVDGLMEMLRGLVGKAIVEGEVAAVHDARVATRRLKAAVNLFEPVLSERSREQMLQVLKKLRRRLGALRDLDVMVEHLGQLQRSKRLGRAALWAAGQMQRQRLAEAKPLAEKGSGRVLGKLGQWWEVRGEIAAAAEAGVTLLAGSLGIQLEEFGRRADAMAPSAADSTAAAAVQASDPAEHDPHALRIAGKALRYTLEMARAAGMPLDKRVLKTFKKLQDALGLWHDYAVLSERVTTLAGQKQLALHDGELYRQVLELAKFTSAKAQRYLGKFVELWGKEGPAVRGAVAAIVPPRGQGPAAPAAPPTPAEPIGPQSEHVNNGQDIPEAGGQPAI